MKQTTKLLGSVLFTALFAGSALAEVRTWTDVRGRQVTASFVSLEADNITLQTADGNLHRFPLSNLSAEDQAIAKASKASAPAAAISANATPAQAATAIDRLVYAGLQASAADRVKMGKKPLTGFNAPASDDMFVRRVYLDITGRIPTHDEAKAFITDTRKDKRTKLVDMLLDSPGYASHMFNYMAEMLRVKDRLEQDNLRGVPYINWLQENIEKNTSWDKMVYEMLTASGKMWHNGAAGYLLRDAGMPLDNLANTLAVFLGTDVACAQCHDHPFSDWTQRQFYEMASFFGGTTTRGRPQGGMAGMNGDVTQKLMPEIESLIEKSGMDITRVRNGLRNYIGANRAIVAETNNNSLKLPHDYKYKDANPGDAVAPKFIVWGKDDTSLPCYTENVTAEGAVKPEKSPREAFSAWVTHPSNPRFAMAIANRMWKRAFGLGIVDPVTNIDDPSASVNPQLLSHLADEMRRVKFNLKDFMRIIYNTRAYQAEATSEVVAMGEPYYFQGPLLRRMTAEQAWDSYMTLALGDPDKYKKPLDDLYSKSIDLDLSNPKLDAQTVLIKYNAYLDMARKERALMGGGLAEAGSEMDGKKAKGKGTAKKDEDAGMMMENASLGYGNLVLRRAAELEQPAPPGHFLIDFGQSPRSLIDGGSKVGSVPQVLMMMNGKAQEMLTNNDSLIFRTMEKVKSSSEKVETLFTSILSRRPTMAEKDIAKRTLAMGDDGYANMIWALINTREFIFIQ